MKDSVKLRIRQNRKEVESITYQGETKTPAEWGRLIGVQSSQITRRIRLYGWSVAKALNHYQIPETPPLTDKMVASMPWTASQMQSAQ